MAIVMIFPDFSFLTLKSVAIHRLLGPIMKKKVLIITAVLISEAWERSDEELEADIKARLSPRDIPWAQEIEKISVLSES